MFIRWIFFTLFCITFGAFSMDTIDQNAYRKELNISLLMAAQAGDQYEIDLLLDNDAYIDTQDSIEGFNENRDTPLLIAAREGHVGVVSQLLDEEARIDLTNIFGHSALHGAVINGQVRIIQKLIKEGANIFLRSDNGTAIELAAQLDRQDILDMLLTDISREDEELIQGDFVLLLCMNRMYIQKNHSGEHTLQFHKKKPGHKTCLPDERLKNVRMLIAKHLVNNAVEERMHRVADFIEVGDPAYAVIRANIEAKIKRIFFGDPVPKKLPQRTIELDDPFGHWFVTE